VGEEVQEGWWWRHQVPSRRRVTRAQPHGVILQMTGLHMSFLDASAELWKATVSFVVSICRPSAWSNWFPLDYQIWDLSIFRKFVEKIGFIEMLQE
jgi:hypothetical protein